MDDEHATWTTDVARMCKQRPGIAQWLRTNNLEQPIGSNSDKKNVMFESGL